MSDRAPLALDLAANEPVAPIVARLVHEGAQIEEMAARSRRSKTFFCSS